MYPLTLSLHGPRTLGNRVIPRLAGQLYPYTVKALSHWERERGQDPTTAGTSKTMVPIVRNMTKSQIAAVAAYLSNLK